LIVDAPIKRHWKSKKELPSDISFDVKNLLADGRGDG
jgi:hypothetical protein